MHCCIKKLESETDGSTTTLVVTVDTIIDPKSPLYQQKAINDIVMSAQEVWRKKNAPEDQIRLVAWDGVRQ